MADKEGGPVTRARSQRSRSKEPTNVTPVTRASRGALSLEAVAEADNLFATPTSTQSQKSGRTESSMSINLNGNSPQNSSGSRVHSPQLSRAQEKDELHNLNDRLAKVLTQNSRYKEENSLLRAQLEHVAETTSADLQDQIDKYKIEMGKLRKCVDVVTAEKDREILAKEKLEAQLRDANSELNGLRSRVDDAESRMKQAEREARDRQQKLAEAEAVAKELDTERQRLEKQLNDALKKLASAQDSLERETLTKTDLENQLKTAMEDSEFQTSLLQSKIQRQSVSVTTVDSALRPQSGPDLAVYTSEFRQMMEDAQAELEENMERAYGQKIDNLEQRVGMQRNQIQDLGKALSDSQRDLKENQKDNKELMKQKQKLEADMEKMDHKYRQHQLESADRIKNLSAQASETMKLYQQLMEENRELQNINTEITAELRMYDNLLKEEEIRLGIQSPTQAEPSSRKRPRYSDGDGLGRSTTPVSRTNRLKRGMERRDLPSSQVRSVIKTSANKSIASGPVRILEVMPGKVIRLENQSDENIPLGEWTLKQKSELGAEVSHKFQKDQVISARSIISVYSASQSHVPHDGNTEILSGTLWISSTPLLTSLADTFGTEVAQYESSGDTVQMGDGEAGGEVSRVENRGVFGSLKSAIFG
ncbi:hypothetical protein RvY_15973 [Ramazzottius varieornatus]|uniref:LTD domain-containing protein n=1 Tax=Ramazzottius varieornatus TaxID=947166 RepID=A0A1D1VWT5_RAMVA|nr:hypothetical protein RvY_15973 [Ramazzottius varieornatus]